MNLIDSVFIVVMLIIIGMIVGWLIGGIILRGLKMDNNDKMRADELNNIPFSKCYDICLAGELLGVGECENVCAFKFDEFGNTKNQVWNQVRNQVWNQVENQVWNQVRNRVEEPGREPGVAYG